MQVVTTFGCITTEDLFKLVWVNLNGNISKIGFVTTFITFVIIINNK